jgi:hypothetical protein
MGGAVVVASASWVVAQFVRRGSQQARALEVLSALSVGVDFEAVQGALELYARANVMPRRVQPGPGDAVLEERLTAAFVGGHGVFADVHVDVLFDVTSVARSGSARSVCLIADFPVLADEELELWTVAPSQVDTESAYAQAWLGERFRLAGDPGLALALLQPPLVDALGRALREVPRELEDEVFPYDAFCAIRWHGRHLVFVMDLLEARPFEDLAPLLESWFAVLRPCAREVPPVVRRDEALVRRARDPMEHVEVRWRAAAALEVPMGATDHAVALGDELEALPEEVHVVLAGMARVAYPEGERRALLDRWIGVGGELGALAMRGMADMFPWDALRDERVDAALRVGCASRALAAPRAPQDPGARDAALVAVFTNRRLGAHLSAVAFDDLTRAGWGPSHEALREIASSAYAPLGEAMIAHMRRRGLAVQDARALHVLAGRGVPEQAQAALLLLQGQGRGEHAGMLSVSAEDGAPGGLTQAGAKGTLSEPE